MSLIDNASTDIAACDRESAAWFKRLRKADVSGQGGASSLSEVLPGFVSNVFFAFGDAKFKVGFGKTDQASMGVLKS